MSTLATSLFAIGFTLNSGQSRCSHNAALLEGTSGPYNQRLEAYVWEMVQRSRRYQQPSSISMQRITVDSTIPDSLLAGSTIEGVASFLAHLLRGTGGPYSSLHAEVAMELFRMWKLPVAYAMPVLLDDQLPAHSRRQALYAMEYVHESARFQDVLVTALCQLGRGRVDVERTNAGSEFSIIRGSYDVEEQRLILSLFQVALERNEVPQILDSLSFKLGSANPIVVFGNAYWQRRRSRTRGP